MIDRFQASLFGLATLLAVGGCKDNQRTELVVEIGSNLAAPSQLDKVDLAVTANGKTQHTPYSLVSDYTLPLVVGVVEAGAVAGTTEIVAAGYLNGSAIVDETAVLNFVENKSMLLKLFLAAECRGDPCTDPAQTCTNGGVCRNKVRLPSDLTPFDSGGAGDGGATNSDGTFSRGGTTVSGGTVGSGGRSSRGGTLLTGGTLGSGGILGGGAGGHGGVAVPTGGIPGGGVAGGSGGRGTAGAGGVQTGGIGGAGGSAGGTSRCSSFACPPLFCAGGLLPNSDPCGCPLCASTPDAGVDGGGPDAVACGSIAQPCCVARACNGGLICRAGGGGGIRGTCQAVADGGAGGTTTSASGGTGGGGVSGYGGSGTGGSGDGCGRGLTECNGTCVNLSRDVSNCNACNHACLAGQECLNGYCCSSGQTECNGSCVDTKSSVLNCGSCGHVCSIGQECFNGYCCTSGQNCAACSGSSFFCGIAAPIPDSCWVNPIDCATALYCGSSACGCQSGYRCDCTLGACVSQCNSGQTECNGSCVDTKSSVLNCGSCGHICSIGQECFNGYCCTSGQNCAACSGSSFFCGIATPIPDSCWVDPIDCATAVYCGSGACGCGSGYRCDCTLKACVASP